MSACGGVPSDSVATVADSPVLKSTFDRWAKLSSQTQGAPNAVVPVYTPPDFTECVAQKTAAGAKSKKKVTPAAAKSECQAGFDQVKAPVMQTLLTAQWIDGQAAAMGIKVSQEDIDKKLEEAKKQAFPQDTNKKFEEFVKSSGQSMEDIKMQFKLQLQRDAIVEQVKKSSGTPSNEEINTYFEKNKDQFGTPEQRTYNMVLAADKAKAEAAKKALEGGASFKDVAKQYSTDANTKNNGGLIKDSVKGQQDPTLDKAAFTAQKGVIVGPVKGSFGYYIVKVDSIKPGNTPPIEKVRPQIISQLKSDNENQALQDFAKEFQEKWKKRTECAKYYIVELCNNAPKQPAGQPGAPAPGGQTTQQTPPQGG